MITFQEVHARLGDLGWIETLKRAGIDERFLRNKHGPCPMCGGRDRFRFDNKGRGRWICSPNSGGCGSGDGFEILVRTLRTDAKGALAWVVGDRDFERRRVNVRPAPPTIQKPQGVPWRVKKLLDETCDVRDCSEVIDYLEARGIWPLPIGVKVRAHPAAEYYDNGIVADRFAALVLPLTSDDGELITAHVTYVRNGKKAEVSAPRKLYSEVGSGRSCAARIIPCNGELGIGEGFESVMSAQLMQAYETGKNIPCWPLLNTALVGNFIPPKSVKILHVFADKDVGGMYAFSRLFERLQGKLDIRFLPPRKKDWNEDLTELRERNSVRTAMAI